MIVLETVSKIEAHRCKIAQFMGLDKTHIIAGQAFEGIIYSIKEDKTFHPARWTIKIKQNSTDRSPCRA